jgi:hypothetical protein
MNQADQGKSRGSRGGLALGSSPRGAAGPPGGAGSGATVVHGGVVRAPLATTPGGAQATKRRPVREVVRHPAAVHLAVLVGYLGAGIWFTWPRAPT